MENILSLILEIQTPEQLRQLHTFIEDYEKMVQTFKGCSLKDRFVLTIRPKPVSDRKNFFSNLEEQK